MASVGHVEAASITYRVVLRQLVTRGRVLALLALSTLLVIVSLAVGVSDEIDEPLEVGVGLIDGLGFTLVVPIVALVFATAALGDTREDATLVYLWLRPMARAPIALGAWLAAVTVSVPVTLVPLTISAVLLDAGSDLVAATIIATVVGVLTYASIFLLLGVLVRNPVIWGVVYILLWEGLVAQFGTAAARMAVRGYTRSILASITDVDLDLGTLSLTAGIVVPALIIVGGIAASGWRLNSMEVA
jgi:ABC-2 type transport system permease protein